MKKIKYFLVAIMAVILCFMCLMTTTFSWFARETQSGNSLLWQGEYNVSNGDNITMETYKLNTSSGEYEKVASDYSFSNSNGISADSRISYRTDITNSGENDQSVSLYMSGLNVTQGNFYLGVNNPLKTYKALNISNATYNMATNDKVRIYVDRNGLLGSEPTCNVAYKRNTSDSSYTYEPMWYDDTVDKFHHDIPIDTKIMFFAGKDWDENSERTVDINVENLQLNPLEPKMFKIKSGSDKCSYDLNNIENGANLVQYYDTINMSKNSTFKLDLKKGDHYTGKPIRYSVTSGNNCISINNDVITANAVGTAKITTTVEGPHGDSISKETTVKVSGGVSVTETSIVTNYAVPGRKNGNDTVVSVYWYINNEGSETLKYEIGDVYLSL